MKSDEEESKPPSVPSRQSSELKQIPPGKNDSVTDLEENLLHLIKALETEDRPSTAVVEKIFKLSAYRGAWPPAEVIKEQEAALPGSGERLMRWTEKQTTHRQNLEKTQVDGNERRMDRGQYFSLTIGLAALTSGTYIISTLNNTIGTIGGIAIVAIGVVTPTAMHIARGIRHWLGDKTDKSQLS